MKTLMSQAMTKTVTDLMSNGFKLKKFSSNRPVLTRGNDTVTVLLLC